MIRKNIIIAGTPYFVRKVFFKDRHAINSGGVKKLFVFTLIILLIMSLVACQKEDEENSDLFEQHQEELLIAEKQASVTQEKQDIIPKEEKDIIPEEEKEIVPEEKIEIAPEEEIEIALENEIQESNTNPEYESEGETMATIQQNELQLFSYEEISEAIKARINGISYGETCDVPYEELRYVKVLHIGFDGQTHSGELIVNKSIAEDIVEIFKELYELEYPIEQMVLVDEYGADDNTSMAANNSSAFNYRKIDGTDRISLHSYGMAIDINPRYNPYVRTRDGETVVTPDNGIKYADRTLECDYYINSEDACYQAFTKRGFLWGGEWKNQKDYQHFYKEHK
jgi:hypothetical protein